MAWAALISLSIGLAALLLWLHAPAALMLGPLVAAIVVRLERRQGAPAAARPSSLAQGIVGCLIAKMVPLSIVGDVLSHWFLFTVGVLAVVAISSPDRLADDALAGAARHDGAVGHQPGRRLGDDHHGRVLRRRRPSGRPHAVWPRRDGGGRRGLRDAHLRRQSRAYAGRHRLVPAGRLAGARRDAGARRGRPVACPPAQHSRPARSWCR